MSGFPHHFETTLNLVDGQNATMASGNLPGVSVTVPPEFKGPGTGWSPEGLQLSAVASCVAFTFAYMARMMKVEYSDLSIAAKGAVDLMPDKRMHFSEIHLTPSLKLGNPGDEAKLAGMWQKTEQQCIISNSLKTPVHIEATVLK